MQNYRIVSLYNFPDYFLCRIHNDQAAHLPVCSRSGLHVSQKMCSTRDFPVICVKFSIFPEI